MECRDAQFYLRFRRPGAHDLASDDAAALERHLASCQQCAADARRTVAFDAAVGTAMRAVPTPDGLRDRLVARVSARRGAILRRKMYRMATAAASVLLAAGIAVGVLTATRPQPDTKELVLKGDTLATSLMAGGQPVNWPGPGRTDPEIAKTNAATVQNWLKGMRLSDELPEPFDYGLFLSCHWEDVQGRKVPVVWFRDRSGLGFAKVYIFRASQFDLKGIRDEQASYCVTKTYPVSGSGITYVVVFTGGPDLTPFLRDQQNGPVALQGIMG